MKRFFTTIFATLIVAMLTISPVFGQNFTSRATIDQKFCSNSVIVILDQNRGGVNRVHPHGGNARQASAFGNFEILYIEDLTYSPNHVRGSRGISMIDEENFRQILMLRLAVDGKQNVLDVIEELRFTPGVYYAYPNFIRYRTTTNMPNDPLFNELWGMSSINAPQAWIMTTGSSNVRVGVVDIGFASHNDLNANIVEGWCFFRGIPITHENMQISPAHGSHGNHVAGTIGAVGNNSIGVTGVAWNVSLVPLEIFTHFSQGEPVSSEARMTAAINWAIDNGISIINMSMSGFGGSPGILTTMTQRPNALLVWSAGNQALNIDGVPGGTGFNIPNIIGVGSHNVNNQRSSFSSFGVNSVSIFAPGSDIVSTVLNNHYSSKGGTSMAAPHVAGVAALLQSIDQTLTPAEIKSIIVDNATPFTISTPIGIQNVLRLNALAAVEVAYGAGGPIEIAQIPYDEGFEETTGTDLPGSWRHSEGPVVWQTAGSTIPGVTGTQAPHSGTRQLVRGAQQAGNSAWAFSQPIRLEAGVTHLISFWYRAPGTATQFDNFKIQIGATRLLGGSGDDAQMLGATTLFELTNQRVGEWTEVSVQFRPFVSGSYFIGFHCMTAAGQGSFIAIDDISITPLPGNNLQIIAEPFVYTQFPTFMPLPTLSARARNNGTGSQVNITLSATLNGTSVGQSSAILFLPVGATSEDLTLSLNQQIVQIGTNELVYAVNSLQENQGTDNLATFSFEGTEDVLARDNVTTFAGGFGSDAPITFGTIFEITSHTLLNGIQVGFGEYRFGEDQNYTTLDYSVSVFAVTEDLTIASTPILTQTATRNATGIFTINVTETELSPGRYFVAVNQLDTTSVTVTTDNEAGRVIYIRDGNYLIPNSAFGAPAIRMVLREDPNPPTNIADVDVETGRASSLQVFPNPATDQLHIVHQLQSGEVVEIFDMNGQRVFAAPITGYQTTIDVSHLPNGIYIVRIGNNTVRIIKQ